MSTTAVVQRVCWNTRGWCLPAGSTDEKGYPGENGFGHEEWNFQLEDAVEGCVYGYMYSPPKKDEGEQFRLHFYAIHPETKQRLLVGSYLEAEVVRESEYRRVLKAFKSKGILDRRARELLRVAPAMGLQKAREEMSNALERAWLKVKCPVEAVKLFEPPVRLPLNVGEKTLSHRFRMFTYVDEAELFKRTDAFSEDPTDGFTRLDLAEDGYLRESRENLKEIVPRHNALSNTLCRWLEARGIHPVQEKQGVDIGFRHQGASYKVEIKIVYGATTRQSLREAVGQLLEYNHYPGRDQCDVWMVLLDCEPKSEHIEYVNNLREERGLPLHLLWKGENGFEFCEPRPAGF